MSDPSSLLDKFTTLSLLILLNHYDVLASACIMSTDRFRNDKRGQRVAGHVQHSQCVEVVEVLGQRANIVTGGKKHLKRTQLTDFGHQRIDAVARDVQHRQQLHPILILIIIIIIIVVIIITSCKVFEIHVFKIRI